MDADIWRLRMVARYTVSEIARANGWSRRTVEESLSRTAQSIRRGAVEETREQELERLDYIEQNMQRIIDATHYVLHKGEVVIGPNGEPMIDPGPSIAAHKVQLDCMAKRAKYTGIEMPIKTETRTYEYTVNGVDHADLK